jgi:hypothetical protein
MPTVKNIAALRMDLWQHLKKDTHRHRTFFPEHTFTITPGVLFLNCLESTVGDHFVTHLYFVASK